jgi:membrane-associated phospholipid phosphatase
VLVRRIQRGDDLALDLIAGVDHGPLRPLLRLTARAGDLLLPWAGVSIALLADGSRRSQSTVGKAWAGAVAAAVVDNAVVKPMTRRSRPEADRLPPGERRDTTPITSAFASGHTAAATAFAVAVGRERPALQWWLAATAAGVGYSLGYTGRHYASDAVIGAAIGAATGALARHE